MVSARIGFVNELCHDATFINGFSKTFINLLKSYILFILFLKYAFSVCEEPVLRDAWNVGDGVGYIDF